MIFETKRLIVLKAEPTERFVAFFYTLWNNPQVMKMVGFPEGLGIRKAEIKEQFANQGKTEFDCRLAVFLKNKNEFIGECKLGFPNEKNVSTTDVKLLPPYWGFSYGKEIKQALCHYLFTNTSCNIVEASPNKRNIASQKMQQYCGGIKVGEHLWEAPKNRRVKQENVASFIYHIRKKDFYKSFSSMQDLNVRFFTNS